MTTNDRIGESGVVRLSGLAGWKWFYGERKHILLVSTDFSLLRAESAFRQWEKKKQNKEKNLPDNPKKEKTRFGLVGRKVYRKVFLTFDLLVFDRVFVSEKRNSQNMLRNIHLESVNLKNYPLICDSLEWELRVGESESFFWLENFGLREFLQNSRLKSKRTKKLRPANTRLCALGGYCAFCSLCARISFVAIATGNPPANRPSP